MKEKRYEKVVEGKVEMGWYSGVTIFIALFYFGIWIDDLISKLIITFALGTIYLFGMYISISYDLAQRKVYWREIK